MKVQRLAGYRFDNLPNYVKSPVAEWRSDSENGDCEGREGASAHMQPQKRRLKLQVVSVSSSRSASGSRQGSNSAIADGTLDDASMEIFCRHHTLATQMTPMASKRSLPFTTLRLRSKGDGESRDICGLPIRERSIVSP
jgi:hypothetical protein